MYNINKEWFEKRCGRGMNFMEELQLKYVEIIFDKQTPQKIDTEINILSRIDNGEVGNLEYKFIVGKGGIWNTIQEFSGDNRCVWKPKREGEYMVMVQAREKDGKKSLDYLAKEGYSIVEGDAISYMSEDEKSVEKAVDESKDNMVFNDAIDNEEKSLLNFKGEEPFINEEFRELINSSEENIVFLDAKELSRYEKEVLVGIDDEGREEMALSENMNKEVNMGYNTNEILHEVILENDKSESKNLEDSIGSKVRIIEDVFIDKEEIMVGEKCSIEVNTNNDEEYLYRFYLRKKDQWDIVRDYDTVSILRYTASEIGEKEFLIQCKRMESAENFEDYKTIKIKVVDTAKVEIVNFKCLSNSLIVGDKLGFIVETNIKTQSEEDVILLYKFYKISKDGKSVCIQDYSTKNDVYYREFESGNYRILCLVKSILSNKEYDDRAVLVYNVKPYKDIKIDSFVANLNSPQASETDIRFTSEVQGGSTLQYRYKVKGPIEEDTGFCDKDEFIWTPMEAGEYEVILYVKDINYKGEYEDTKKIAFTIEKKGKKPVKILDIVIDKEKKIIAGEPVNIMVNGEGGTQLQYAFRIRKNNKKVESIEYNRSNWIDFMPKEFGEYEVEIMIKDKYSDKLYDAQTFINFKAMEYLPGEIDYIILPYKETFLIGDTIEFECIIQNTQSVLVKYETKINGNSIEQTEFSKK